MHASPRTLDRSQLNVTALARGKTWMLANGECMITSVRRPFLLCMQQSKKRATAGPRFKTNGHAFACEQKSGAKNGAKNPLTLMRAISPKNKFKSEL